MKKLVYAIFGLFIIILNLTLLLTPEYDSNRESIVNPIEYWTTGIK